METIGRLSFSSWLSRVWARLLGLMSVLVFELARLVSASVRRLICSFRACHCKIATVDRVADTWSSTSSH